MRKTKNKFTLKQYYEYLSNWIKNNGEMGTTYHVQMSIDGVLALSDKKLSKLFNGDGKQIRKQLKERYSKGERLIGAEGCEGFDPIKGCPGHPEEIK